jgi:hypothetical protein
MFSKFSYLIYAAVIFWSGCTKKAEPAKSEQWTTSEITLISERDYLNGYTDAEVWAVFSNEKNDSIIRPAFWDGGKTWKIRFAPTDG